MKNTLICLAIALSTAQTYAAESTSAELVNAYKVIQQYRDLRESCASGSYDMRRHCVSELSKASAAYRAAKDVIAQSKGTPSNTLASYN